MVFHESTKDVQHKGENKPTEEGPIKIVHRENYNTFEVLLGKGMCAMLGVVDLVSCYDSGT